MKKNLYIAFLLLFLPACSYFYPENRREVALEEPDYRRLVDNVSIVAKNSDGIIYEYRNIRVDELALMAALYCQEQGEKRASLEKIILHRNNARRASFICKK